MAHTAAYHGHTAALLTQHGKEAILGPVLNQHLGCTVQHVTGFDTDQLGTFTREQPRSGTQLDAARRKARVGMDLSGLPLGLASEGSFGMDPHMGLVPWNVEIVIWIDDRRSLEVVGMAQGPADDRQSLLNSREALHTFATEAGFPAHGLVLRPEGPDDARVYKNLATWADLNHAFDKAMQEAANGAVFVESDLRAHRNPTRQALIHQAGLDLAQRLLSACPVCQSPGFSRQSHVPGLRCRACGRRTHLPVAETWRCTCCGHEAQLPLPTAEGADPAQCSHCNP
jgi:hypothetical protein